MDATHRSTIARTPGRRSRSRTIAGRITASALSCSLALSLFGLTACSDAIDGRGTTTIEARFSSNTGSINESGSLPRPRQDSMIYSPRIGPDQTVLALAFPTGRVKTSTVLLHEVMPTTVDLGRPFVLEYHVTNLTTATLDEVRVHLHDAENLTLLDCSVHPRLDDTTLYWPLGRLGPGQTRVVRVSARADAVGAAETTATVTYQNVLRSQTQVVEPRLSIRKAAPAFGARDEVFELVYTLANDGSGTARKITITDELPPGLTTIDGGRRVSLPVLALGPGQSQEQRVRVRASRVGPFASSAVAVAEPELRAQSGAPETLILDPQIAISVEGAPVPDTDGHSRFIVMLSNTGLVTARAARVTVPVGSDRVVSTSAPAAVGPDSLTLGCDTLLPGESVEFEMVLRDSDTDGLLVTAVADHAGTVRAVASRSVSPRVAAADRAPGPSPR